MSVADERALEARAKARGVSVWQLRMMEAVPDDVIRAIVLDNRNPTHSLPSKASIGPPTPAAPQRPRGTGGWIEPSTQRSSGDWAFNKMMDAADAADRAALAAKLAELRKK